MSALTPQIELSNYQNLKKVNEDFLNVLQVEKKQVLHKYLFENENLKTVTEKLVRIKIEIKQRIAKQ